MRKGCFIAFFSFLGAVLLLFVLVGLFINQKNDFSSAPVVVIKIEGPIFEVDDILAELEEVRLSDEVKAVVLRINSPGGAVAPSQEIYLQVLKIRQAGKKVVVSMGTVAASGGYYIAAAADKIFANSGSITGSIGVIMENFGLQRVLQYLQIESRTIKSGKYKDVGNPFREMTNEDTSYLQDLTDNMYHIFTQDMALARKIDIEKLDEIAQGKIYTGSQAKEVGLVDEIGNFYDAIHAAKVLAGLPENAEVKWPKEPTPFEVFLGEKAMSHYVGKIVMWLQFQDLPMWKLPATGL